MFRSGDVIKSTHSRHTTWRVIAVVYDGRLLAKRVTGGKYRPDEDVKFLTRPETYCKVGESTRLTAQASMSDNATCQT